MDSGIYKIVNTKTHKCYVGSAKNFHKRWLRHKRDLRNNSHSSIKLQRSWNKHGEEFFVFEVVEMFPYETSIVEREDYYIKLLNSKCNGYNIADASFGDTLTNHPDKVDIISRISRTLRANLNKMTQEERNEKFGRSGELNGRWNPHKVVNNCSCGKVIPNSAKTCSTCRKRDGENNPFHGKTHSSEVREIISRKAKGRKPPNVKKISADGKTFDCAADAARHFNISKGLVTYRVKSEKYDWFYINA